jgi:MFS family permease
MFSRIAENIGANRIVLALSLARLGDAKGNSIL